MRDLPRVGLMWGVLYLSAFLVLIIGCSQSTPEAPPPHDKYKSFDVEYIRMNSYVAFQNSGNYSQLWVGNRFVPCSSFVYFYATNSGLADTMLTYDPSDQYRLSDYKDSNIVHSWGTIAKYRYHLFAIRSFKDRYGNEITNLPGATIEFEQTSFVCDHLITYWCGTNGGNWLAARAQTVVHELGHCIADLTDRCDHVAWHGNCDNCPCTMANLSCGGYDAYLSCPALTWDLATNIAFCDSCVATIRRTSVLQ
jgi:hypothetical protein